LLLTIYLLTFYLLRIEMMAAGVSAALTLQVFASPTMQAIFASKATTRLVE